ncbi:MAG TPA: ATPase domain-containing protein, partial [Beijerinckiaceae bacterium]|nr:ATPase domain-containing protein [Beijerinckiaceae bacterium]
KTKGVTALFTSLSTAGEQMSESERSVSSLMDTWISLQDVEANGERNRVLYVLKSRGMNHSKQLREYRLTDHSIELVDAYIGPDGVLTGTARLAQEAREKEAALERRQATERRRREVQRKRATVERQIAEMRAAVQSEEAEVATLIEQENAREVTRGADRVAMAASRRAGS